MVSSDFGGMGVNPNSGAQCGSSESRGFDGWWREAVRFVEVTGRSPLRIVYF